LNLNKMIEAALAQYLEQFEGDLPSRRESTPEGKRLGTPPPKAIGGPGVFREKSEKPRRRRRRKRTQRVLVLTR
jgi:hypothetical protein